MIAVKISIVFSIVTFFLGVPIVLHAQGNETPKPADSGTPTIILSTDEDYLVGPNDVLDIRVDDAPELAGFYKLNSKGSFTIPVIGKVDAKDKTIEQIIELLTNRLKSGYLVKPIVSVRLSQSNRRAYFIQGAVRIPGTYQIEGRVSLLKLITIAGGLKDEYGPIAFVMRDKDDDRSESDPVAADNVQNVRDDYDLIRVNINQLLKGNLKNNVEIEAGDIVQIPVSEEFFVAGEVEKPGAFPLKEGTTVQQAISLAGGLSEKSGSTAFLVREKDERADPDGDEFDIIEIDLNKLFRGQLAKNIMISPRDFLQITEAGTFYVAGEVEEPGSFSITKDGVTLRQAISLAKGTKYEGNLKNSVIFRLNQTGGRDKIEVNIAAIMKGETEDVAIMSNDILIVPNSKSKAFTKSIWQLFTTTLPSLIVRRGI